MDYRSRTGDRIKPTIFTWYHTALNWYIERATVMQISWLGRIYGDETVARVTITIRSDCNFEALLFVHGIELLELVLYIRDVKISYKYIFDSAVRFVLYMK